MNTQRSMWSRALAEMSKKLEGAQNENKRLRRELENKEVEVDAFRFGVGTLQNERDELRAHIERWKVQSLSKYVEHEPDHEGMCFADGMKWPCPTEVAKGLEG